MAGPTVLVRKGQTLRAGPDQDSSIIFTFQEDSPANVVEHLNDYTAITGDDFMGWILTRELEEAYPTETDVEALKSSAETYAGEQMRQVPRTEVAQGIRRPSKMPPADVEPDSPNASNAPPTEVPPDLPPPSSEPPTAGTPDISRPSKMPPPGSSESDRTNGTAGDSDVRPPAVAEVDLLRGQRVAANFAVSDSAATRDSLGRQYLVDGLVDFVTHPETQPPFGIGVTAPWGSGKTWLMLNVKQELDKRRNDDRKQRTARAWLNRRLAAGEPETESGFSIYRTAWVDAWRYENSSALWAAMSKEVFSQVSAQMGRWERLKFNLALNTDWGEGNDWPAGSVLTLPRILARRLQRLSVLTSLIALAVTGLLGVVLEFNIDTWIRANAPEAVAATGLGTGLVAFLAGLPQAILTPLRREISKSASPDGSNKVSYSPASEQQIRRMIKILSRPEENPREKRRLAVFIDDLDRCSPERVMDVVELITLLYSPLDRSVGAVFFIGLDQDIIAANITVAFKDTVAQLDKSHHRLAGKFGYNFLQKILQLTISLPPLTQSTRETFVRAMPGYGRLGAALNGTSPSPVQPAKTHPVSQERVEAYESKLAGWTDDFDKFRESLREEQKSIDDPAELEALAIAGRRAASKRFKEDSREVQTAIAAGSVFLERPREIKRFVSAFRLQVLIGVAASDSTLTLEQLAKWTAIHGRWPMLLEEVKSDLATFHYLERVARDLAKDLDNLAKPSADRSEGFDALLSELPPRVMLLPDLDELIKQLAKRPMLPARAKGQLLAVT